MIDPETQFVLNNIQLHLNTLTSTVQSLTEKIEDMECELVDIIEDVEWSVENYDYVDYNERREKSITYGQIVKQYKSLKDTCFCGCRIGKFYRSSRAEYMQCVAEHVTTFHEDMPEWVCHQLGLDYPEED